MNHLHPLSCTLLHREVPGSKSCPAVQCTMRELSLDSVCSQVACMCA